MIKIWSSVGCALALLFANPASAQTRSDTVAACEKELVSGWDGSSGKLTLDVRSYRYRFYLMGEQSHLWDIARDLPESHYDVVINPVSKKTFLLIVEDRDFISFIDHREQLHKPCDLAAAHRARVVGWTLHDGREILGGSFEVDKLVLEK